MIGSMKKLKADLAENGQAESRSSASAFEALFMEHWAPVYRILQRIVGDPAEAEDLAAKAIDQFHDRVRFTRQAAGDQLSHLLGQGRVPKHLHFRQIIPAGGRPGFTQIRLPRLSGGSP